MSITEVTGYDTVEKIYIQLLYQCNFSCKHCFHGRQLESPQQLSVKDLQNILTYFRSEYGTRYVTLLGGEPFLHPNFIEIAKWCAAHEWFVETCTNGHRFVHRQLPGVAHSLHLLRVSIDGLQRAHDAMRMRGSFAHAIETLCIARTLGITTGVTSTVTADNAQDLPDLAQLVSRYGVRELKLHQLRIVGNARTSQLQTAGKEQLSQLINWIKSGETHLKVIYDDDLDPSKSAVPSASANRGVLDRIEVDPDLGFTMSCKAVGTNAQAFYWSPKLNTIEYRPSQMDEVQCPVPNVNYA